MPPRCGMGLVPCSLVLLDEGPLAQGRALSPGAWGTVHCASLMVPGGELGVNPGLTRNRDWLRSQLIAAGSRTETWRP